VVYVDSVFCGGVDTSLPYVLFCSSTSGVMQIVFMLVMFMLMPCYIDVDPCYDPFTLLGQQPVKAPEAPWLRARCSVLLYNSRMALAAADG